MLQRPGSSWGFGALLKDTSVVVLKEDTPPTNNPCRTWDSNPQPSAYKSDSLSIRPRVPLRDDCVECWTEVYEQQSDISVRLKKLVILIVLPSVIDLISVKVLEGDSVSLRM